MRANIDSQLCLQLNSAEFIPQSIMLSNNALGMLKLSPVVP